MSAFLGMMLGTGLIALIGDYAPVLLGIQFTSVQLLLLIQALGNLLVPVVIFSRFRTLDPAARLAAK